MNVTDAKVLLASNSPRRRELLAMIVPDFIVADQKHVDETYPSDLNPLKIPEYLSHLKAKAYADALIDDEIIITADTIVINDAQVLGKPHDESDAISMLKSLMGHSHTVVTGVTLTSTHNTDTFSELTEVTFDTLSDKEIEDYVLNYRPMDKAGAYGIQEWIGCAAISGIKGCFYNVMGLPLHTLYMHLRSFKY